MVSKIEYDFFMITNFCCKMNSCHYKKIRVHLFIEILVLNRKVSIYMYVRKVICPKAGLSLDMSSFSNLSVTSSTSQLILQTFCRFAYVTAQSPTLSLLHLRHSLFSNPSLASPTSQALHLIHLASRPWGTLNLEIKTTHTNVFMYIP